MKKSLEYTLNDEQADYLYALLVGRDDDDMARAIAEKFKPTDVTCKLCGTRVGRQPVVDPWSDDGLLCDYDCYALRKRAVALATEAPQGRGQARARIPGQVRGLLQAAAPGLRPVRPRRSVRRHGTSWQRLRLARGAERPGASAAEAREQARVVGDAPGHADAGQGTWRRLMNDEIIADFIIAGIASVVLIASVVKGVSAAIRWWTLRDAERLLVDFRNTFGERRCPICSFHRHGLHDGAQSTPPPHRCPEQSANRSYRGER